MRRIRLYRIGLGLLLAVASFGVPLVASGNSYAAESGGVGAKPANPVESNPRTSSIFVYTLKQGELATDGVDIFNNTSETKTISVYATDSAVSTGGSFTCKQKVEKSVGVGSWVSLSNDTVTLKSNEHKVIPFTVTVPANAPAGEQNGCIVVQDINQQPTQAGRGVTINTRSAVRLAVTVPGELNKSLSIVSVDLSRHGDGYMMSATLKNNGNVSIDTDVTVELRGLLGDIVIRRDGGNFPVLPYITSSFNFDISRPFFGGFYREVATIHYNNDPAKGIGQGDKNTELTETRIVYLEPSPWAVVLEILFLLILIASLVWFYLFYRSRQDWQRNARNYKVKAGDTIQTIAEKQAMNWKVLARRNHLKAPFVLKKGQTIKVLKPRKKS